MQIEKSKYVAFATLIFAFIVFWLFIFADMDDTLRHGSENLFIFFGSPFWITACVVSRLAGHVFWRLFPKLAPRRARATTSYLPVLVSILAALTAAVIWRISPLFVLIYGSSKAILLILIAGSMLGLIGKVGGLGSVLLSVLSGVLSAVIASAAILIFLFMWVGREDLLSSTGVFASLGVPFAVSVAFYDCYRKALIERP